MSRVRPNRLSMIIFRAAIFRRPVGNATWNIMSFSAASLICRVRHDSFCVDTWHVGPPCCQMVFGFLKMISLIEAISAFDDK
eukprot:4589013-Karenia_brevis.AAC.1